MHKMLELLLIRRYLGASYTIGSLYINGVYFCDVLEDPDRRLTSTTPEVIIRQKKIYGNTAIPTGTYHVAMDTVSPKFKSRYWAVRYKGIVPRILSVPGFDGVLIHVGNTPADTLGCLLVGENKVKGQVINSANTFYRLMDKYLMPAAARGEDVMLTIRYN